ncbi:MAG: gas vesicle protein GvpG [Chloroflexota bacterium]
MGLILDLLTLPVLGAPRMVHWLSQTIVDQAERELLDEGRVQGRLLELQQRYDAGEVGDEEYDREERTLLERLSAIRELKAGQDLG